MFFIISNESNALSSLCYLLSVRQYGIIIIKLTH